MAKNPDPDLYRVYGHYNRKHFGGKLPKPAMLRYVREPYPEDPRAMAVSTQDMDGTWRVLLSEKLRGHPGFVRSTLVHEMVHLWGFLRRWTLSQNNCETNGSRHHRKMLTILKHEADLC